MSHPINKYQRRLVGVRKGQRRAFYIWKNHSPESVVRNADFIAEDEQSFRDRTTSCPCVHCRADRQVRGPGLQELRFRDHEKEDLRLLVEPKESIEVQQEVLEEEYSFLN